MRPGKRGLHLGKTTKKIVRGRHKTTTGRYGFDAIIPSDGKTGTETTQWMCRFSSFSAGTALNTAQRGLVPAGGLLRPPQWRDGIPLRLGSHGGLRMGSQQSEIGGWFDSPAEGGWLRYDRAMGNSAKLRPAFNTIESSGGTAPPRQSRRRPTHSSHKHDGRASRSARRWSTSNLQTNQLCVRGMGVISRGGAIGAPPWSIVTSKWRQRPGLSPRFGWAGIASMAAFGHHRETGRCRVRHEK